MSANPSSFISLEEVDASISRLVLARPPVNALSRAFVAELRERAEQLAREAAPQLAVLLVEARGRAFCAGADLKERAGMSEAEVLETVAAIGAAVDAVARIPVPTIAVLSGAALGGGFEIALACDLRVAALGARVGLPECRLAIIPGAGGTQRLARLVGPARAKRWIYTGRVARAEEAVRDGLVDEVVEGEKLPERALELARDIARSGPLALRAAKKAIDEGLAAGALEDGLFVEKAAYETILGTEDRLEALRAFADKRPPTFSGR